MVEKYKKLVKAQPFKRVLSVNIIYKRPDLFIKGFFLIINYNE